MSIVGSVRFASLMKTESTSRSALVKISNHSFISVRRVTSRSYHFTGHSGGCASACVMVFVHLTVGPVMLALAHTEVNQTQTEEVEDLSS